MNLNQETRNNYIIYISDHVNELKPKYRKELLQIIICSSIPDKQIIEKGSGTQIKFSSINDTILNTIYNFIYNKLETNSLLFE
jgi:hypothetical protein